MGLKDYTYIRSEVEKMIKPKRFRHSLNVEKETVRLCLRYGIDEEKGRLAAILHDCAKGFTDGELLEYAAQQELELDEVTLHLPDLLHGPIAAILAKERFGLTEDEMDVFDAIWFHTTGKKDMSDLEKIIYLADMIEESRSFDGIDQIRKAAIVDLDSAVLMSCNCTIEYVLQSNRLIHPLTIELRNSLIMRGANQIG